MLSDARLLDPIFLTLAALRCHQRQVEDGWKETQGLCALLAAYRQHPAPALDQAEVAARAEAGDGMARLLLAAWRETSCEEKRDGD